MAIQLPSDFRYGRVQLLNNTPTTETTSRSLRTFKRRTAGHRWEFDIESTNMLLRDAKRIMATLSRAVERLEPLELVLPVYSSSATASKSALVTRNAGADNINLNNTLGIQVGDFFTTATHTKAYQVTSVASNQITFAPRLQAQVASGSTLTFNGCKFTCWLVNEPVTLQMTGQTNVTTLQFDVVEAV